MWTSVESSSGSWQLSSFTCKSCCIILCSLPKVLFRTSCLSVTQWMLWAHSSDCCFVANMELMDSELGFHGISICLDRTGRQSSSTDNYFFQQRAHSFPPATSLSTHPGGHELRGPAPFMKKLALPKLISLFLIQFSFSNQKNLYLGCQNSCSFLLFIYTNVLSY